MNRYRTGLILVVGLMVLILAGCNLNFVEPLEKPTGLTSFTTAVWKGYGKGYRRNPTGNPRPVTVGGYGIPVILPIA